MERNVIDIKKEKLRIELSKDPSRQDKNIIKRLKESIKRHKKIGRPKKFFKFKKKNRVRNKRKR